MTRDKVEVFRVGLDHPSQCCECGHGGSHFAGPQCPSVTAGHRNAPARVPWQVLQVPMTEMLNARNRSIMFIIIQLVTFKRPLPSCHDNE